MKILPNGCSCTELWVSPENWQTTTSKASLNKQWYVQCTYYDPLFKEKYPKGFPFRKKLNKFKTLADRKAAAKLLLEEIPKLFQDLGYNPITKKYMIEKEPEPVSNDNSLTEICSETPFLIALELAHKSIKVADSTYNDIKYMLNKFIPAAKKMKYDEIKISDIKRKHIRFVFDYLEKTEETFSAHKFNKYRSCLSTLFREIIEYEAIESDIPISIKKRIQESKIRETLTLEERKRITSYLKPNFPDFFRFINIFFHSGGRITELLDLKVDDVSIESQSYQVFIKKGRQYKWVKRVIKDVALDYWIKSLYGAKKGDFLFSVGLVPGKERIRREQIGRRWKTHVKDKLNISADFYSLKHSNLDEISELLSIEDAAKLASHTSTKMIEKHYAVGQQERQLQRIKSVKNEFA